MYNIYDKYNYVLVVVDTCDEDNVDCGEGTLYEIMDDFMYYIAEYIPKNLSKIDEIRNFIIKCNTYFISGEVAYKLFLVNNGKIERFYQWELLYPKICEIRQNVHS